MGAAGSGAHLDQALRVSHRITMLCLEDIDQTQRPPASLRALSALCPLRTRSALLGLSSLGAVSTLELVELSGDHHQSIADVCRQPSWPLSGLPA